MREGMPSKLERKKKEKKERLNTCEHVKYHQNNLLNINKAKGKISAGGQVKNLFSNWPPVIPSPLETSRRFAH